LDLSRVDGPRRWSTDDIAAHLPLFKDFAPASNLLAKAGGWDESKHPLVPAGSPDGERFQSAGNGGANTGRDGPAVEGRSAAKKPDENGGPPQTPKDEPPTEKPRNIFAKLAAKWLARALAGAATGPAGEFTTTLEVAEEIASWHYDKYPHIKAYLDRPKSLEELQRDVGKPEKGYEVHHIVEKSAAASDGHSREDIDEPENLVRIPTLKHWEIKGWYMTPNELYNYHSPREYLKGKSWEERRRVGLEALIEAGVLKL